MTDLTAGRLDSRFHDRVNDCLQVKLRLNQRLQELEPLPELLRTTEFKLQDATDQLLAYERKNTDNTKLIAELTAKVLLFVSEHIRTGLWPSLGRAVLPVTSVIDIMIVH